MKMEFKKKDIIYGRKGSDAIHPIVYLRGHDELSFIGAMLTSSHQADNIPMAASHFKETDDDGRKFELSFRNTFLVNASLIKRSDWRPFRKVGELTDEGIKFLESKIGDKQSKFWEEYLKNKTVRK